jgi:hypothetical protein
MPPIPHRRGGQPGNRNSVKHGFYSKKFTPVDHADLDHIEVINFGDEIDLLRVSSRRLFESSTDLQDPLEIASVVRTLSFAVASLARLISLQKLNIPGENIGDALREAVRNIMGDHPLMKDLDSPNDPPPTYFMDPFPPIGTEES